MPSQQMTPDGYADALVLADRLAVGAQLAEPHPTHGRRGSGQREGGTETAARYEHATNVARMSRVANHAKGLAQPCADVEPVGPWPSRPELMVSGTNGVRGCTYKSRRVVAASKNSIAHAVGLRAAATMIMAPAAHGSRKRPTMAIAAANGVSRKCETLTVDEAERRRPSGV
eukprot:scaffold28332_cov31-Tisochrysis_lutea.AAC.7